MILIVSYRIFGNSMLLMMLPNNRKSFDIDLEDQNIAWNSLSLIKGIAAENWAEKSRIL